jgi:IclR family KDG regulon transcriptional repressor
MRLRAAARATRLWLDQALQVRTGTWNSISKRYTLLLTSMLESRSAALPPNLAHPGFMSGSDSRVKSDRLTNSLERALAILEFIAHKSGGLTNAEISGHFKMATSTSSYILKRLEREGYLRRDPDNARYEMGLKIVALSHGALRDMGLRRIAEPILHRLSSETKTSALIGVLERGRVMIVDKVEKPDLARIDIDIGVRYPAHSTALGKVLLAHLPERQLVSLFDHYGLPKTSPKTIDSRSRLLEELQIVQKQGHAVSDGELFLGIRAIAAPIFDASEEVSAAVSVTGVTVSVDEESAISTVKAAAREISRCFRTAMEARRS